MPALRKNAAERARGVGALQETEGGEEGGREEGGEMTKSARAELNAELRQGLKRFGLIRNENTITDVRAEIKKIRDSVMRKAVREIERKTESLRIELAELTAFARVHGRRKVTLSDVLNPAKAGRGNVKAGGS